MGCLASKLGDPKHAILRKQKLKTTNNHSRTWKGTNKQYGGMVSGDRSRGWTENYKLTGKRQRAQQHEV